MLKNLHPKAKIHTTEHLYWNEFPFKLVFQFNSKADKGNRRGRLRSNGREGKLVRTHFAPILTEANCRVNRLGYSVIYYLKDLTTAQAMVDHTPEFMNLSSVWVPLDDDHIKFMVDHPDAVTRFAPYHGIYHYFTYFTGDYRTMRNMHDWCTEHAKERGTKAVKFVRKSSERIDAYFANDVELVVAKLIHGGHMGKIKQVHILNKNNNKAGISDESHSLSETT